MAGLSGIWRCDLADKVLWRCAGVMFDMLLSEIMEVQDRYDVDIQ